MTITTATAEATEIDQGVLKTIADHIRRGQCILFLGAGVHRGPTKPGQYPYSKRKSPPIAKVLARYLARKSQYARAYGKASPYDLQRVALHFEYHDHFKRSDLIKELRRAVQDNKEPSAALRGLAELDFPLVITTNYDRLFERALFTIGKEFVRSVYSPSETRPTEDFEVTNPAHPYVLKIHGDIEDASSIVITDEDYIQFVLRMSDRDPTNPISLGMRYHLKKWPTLFVGYSLKDYNLRLLFKTLRWRVDPVKFPTSYAIDPYPDPLVVKVLSGKEQHISFIATDVWSFVPALYKAVKGTEMPL